MAPVPEIERYQLIFAIGIGIAIAIENQDPKADTDGDFAGDSEPAGLGLAQMQKTNP